MVLSFSTEGLCTHWRGGSQEGSGLRLHNTMPSPAAAAAYLSDLWNSTIAGQITDRNTKQGSSAASDLVERWKNGFKMGKTYNIGLHMWACSVSTLEKGEKCTRTWDPYLPLCYFNLSDINLVYLLRFIFWYLQLQMSLKREVKVKQKSIIGTPENRSVFSFALINLLVHTLHIHISQIY